MELTVGRLAGSVEALDVELVERKGIGHPDTICDGLAEAFSAALCRLYRRRFGLILHHNVDKALLRGGASQPAFGGGVVTEPIEIYLAGRATTAVGSERIDVDAVALETTRRWLGDNLHALDVDRHVSVRCLVRPGSAELVDLWRRHATSGQWLANDTSLGAGYAPASRLERAVLAASAALESLARDAASPEIGEDIKVMGLRRRGAIELWIACAVVDRHVRDVAHYLERCARARDAALAAARAAVPGVSLGATFNAADDPASGSVYLTVTGTSAEAGDDGQVGRGNRANGLIAPCRPMTLEAACGKNPVAHVGKIYNLVARDVAQAVVTELPEVAEAECRMLSAIGRPVRDPVQVDVRVLPRDGRVGPAALADGVRRVVDAQLARLDALVDDVVAGRSKTY